jgi:putative nucleotidyltransferase with HDIG domain
MIKRDNLLDVLVELPSIPVIIQKLHNLLDEKSDYGVLDVASIIETDPAFTLKVLRLVNSAFYGCSRKIVSVSEAITILGFNTVHHLLLTTSLLDVFKTPHSELDTMEFWLHSFGVGTMAKKLLHNADSGMQNEAFISGILHDIGRIILARLEPELFHEVYFDNQKAISIEREIDHFGIDHATLSEKLARKWNFPDSIATAVAKHHSFNEVQEHVQLSAAIYIADILCHLLRVGDSGNPYITEFYPKAWQALDVSLDDLDPIINSALDEIRKSQSIIYNLQKS